MSRKASLTVHPRDRERSDAPQSYTSDKRKTRMARLRIIILSASGDDTRKIYPPLRALHSRDCRNRSHSLTLDCSPPNKSTAQFSFLSLTIIQQSSSPTARMQLELHTHPASCEVGASAPCDTAFLLLNPTSKAIHSSSITAYRTVGGFVVRNKWISSPHSLPFPVAFYPAYARPVVYGTPCHDMHSIENQFNQPTGQELLQVFLPELRQLRPVDARGG